MVLSFADLAGTTSRLALLTAVTNTMTFLTAQETSDGGLNTGHLLVRATTSRVTELIAVVALLDATVKRGTSVGKTSQVLFRRSGPLVEERRTLSLVGSEVADCVFLADFALKVHVCPGITMIFLHGNEVDAKSTAAALFLELLVGVIWARLGKDLDSFFEVTNVPLIAGLLQQSPRFIFALLRHVGFVKGFRVLALQSDMT